MIKLIKGMRVRFMRDNLGASEEDALHRVVDEVFNKGDEGVVAFLHPNQKGCKGWWYVEVESKARPGHKLYVGIWPEMVEKIL